MAAPLLTLITFLPAAAGLLLAPLKAEKGAVVRWVALGVSFVVLLLAAVAWGGFQPGGEAIQLKEDVRWVEGLKIRYTMGVDGISLAMIALTAFLMPLAIRASWHQSNGFIIALLFLETGMMGAFCALDLFLFYVFWEAMLIPMYLLIGIWGGPRRIYASVKFIIYTIVGSVLMLAAILYVALQAGTFDVITLQQRLPGANLEYGNLCFLAFALSFAIKVPLFPFHTWLPDAHVEAPTAGSVILAGILLKLGTYGFLRVALPFFPGVAMYPWVRTTIIVLAVIGVIYGSLVALVQPDIKKLVAYSSVAHLGFVMLGIFALTVESVQGALMVMIGHGLSTGALFLLVGIIYERTHTRLIDDYGGIAKVVPLFATILTIVALSSIGLPGTNGFVAEFLVMLGSFRTYPMLTVVSATGVILAAAYLLWALQRMIYNALDRPANAQLKDLNWRELGLLVPILAGIIWMGVYPKPVLDRMEASAQKLVQEVTRNADRQRASMMLGGR